MGQEKTTNSSELLELLKSEASKVDMCMQEDLNALKPETDELLLQVLEYGLFNGGKRVRPLLAVTAARLCGGASEKAYKLGIAFEYLHGATLFHDDIIDQSDTRRGKPCLHKEFGLVHAILAGDFLHAHSMALVGELTGRAGLKIFCKATKGMVDGEFMQLKNAQRHNLSELDYYNAIMGKTGLLISAACEIGGVFGGGSAEEVAALRSYGENLGCAFQIADDLLDYQGDPLKTGKKIGNDLIEAKMTLPLILAVSKANSQDKDRLMVILSDKDLRKSCFEEVYGLIEKYDGFIESGNRAHQAITTAVKDIQIFSSRNVADERKLLEALAQFVVSREK